VVLTKDHKSHAPSTDELVIKPYATMRERGRGDGERGEEERECEGGRIKREGEGE
jgi:hypothetical protein